MRWLLAPLLAVVGILPVRALEIRPVSVSVPAGTSHAEVWLENTGNTPWDGQARLYRWEQAGDQEHLLPAGGVAVSPVHLTLAPGQGQRVRVVRLGGAPDVVQQAYRLVLSPGPDAAAGTARYSLPVFLEPQAVAPRSRLRVAIAGGTGAPLLRLYNDGAAHAHLADLAFVDAQGRRHGLIDGLAGYVLPHSARSWTLPPRPDGYAGGRFQARLDHAAEAALPSAAPEIAAPPQAGL
jgi:fimbrial chaperone protein